MHKWAGLLLLALSAVTCRQKATQWVEPERVLFGGEQCREDKDCFLGRCSFGMCVGILMSPTEATRMEQVAILKGLARDPNFREQTKAFLLAVVEETGSDVFLRARAVYALSAVADGRELSEVLLRQLGAEEPVKFQAARVLHEMGDQRGTEVLKEFVGHPAPGVRALAEFVLGNAYGASKK